MEWCLHRTIAPSLNSMTDPMKRKTVASVTHSWTMCFVVPVSRLFESVPRPDMTRMRYVFGFK